MNIRTPLILSTLLASTSLFAATTSHTIERESQSHIHLRFDSPTTMVRYAESLDTLVSNEKYNEVIRTPIDVDFACFPEGRLRIESKESYIFTTKLAYAVSYKMLSDKDDARQEEYLRQAKQYATEYLDEFGTVRFHSAADRERLRNHLFTASRFAGDRLLDLTNLYCMHINQGRLNESKKNQMPLIIQESLSHYSNALLQGSFASEDIAEIYFNIITQYGQLTQFPGQNFDDCLSKAEENLLLLEATNQPNFYLSAKENIKTIKNIKKSGAKQNGDKFEKKAIEHVERAAAFLQEEVIRSPTEIFFNNHRMVFLDVKRALYDMAQTKKGGMRLLSSRADEKESTINPIITAILGIEADIHRSLHAQKVRKIAEHLTSELHSIYAKYHKNVGEENFVMALLTYITYFHTHGQIEDARERSHALLSVLEEKSKNPQYIFLARILCATSEKKLGDENRLRILQEEESTKQNALQKKRAKNKAHKQKQKEKKRDAAKAIQSIAEDLTSIQSLDQITLTAKHVEEVQNDDISNSASTTFDLESPGNILPHRSDALRSSVHAVIRDFCAPPGFEGSVVDEPHLFRAMAESCV